MVLKPIKKLIYNAIRVYRCKYILKNMNKEYKSILDIGASDLYFCSKLKKKGFDYTAADIEPKLKEIKKENIEKLSFKDKSFDVVMCLEVLEHTENPLKAIDELKRVAKKQIIISVPYEPFFTLFRFFIWEKEHLWAITPKLLEKKLGKPSFHKKLFFRRYYFAIWNL